MGELELEGKKRSGEPCKSHKECVGISYVVVRPNINMDIAE